MSEPLTLSLCPVCDGQAPEVGVCSRCGGAGCFDNHGEPFRAPPPFDRWTPRALVQLSDTSVQQGRTLNRHTIDPQQREGLMAAPKAKPAAPPATIHRRLTLSDVVELAFATLNRSGVDHSTVKLTRNAKGDTQIEVSVRTGEPGVETVEQAAAKAREVYDGIAAAYPMSEPAPTSSPLSGPRGVVSDAPPPAKPRRKRDGS